MSNDHNKTKRAAFITIEGIEGAGKSTITKLIHKVLNQHNIPHQLTREPGGTPFAESIRQLSLKKHSEKVDPKTELLLMFASRAQHIAELIRPCIGRGDWVVCDRFTDASYAYQGGGRALGQDNIAALERIVHPDLQPDLTILLDIKPSMGFRRIAKRQHQDRIEQEQLEFFSNVRQAYLTRAKTHAERFVVINANQVLSKVKNDVKFSLEQFIERFGHD